MPELTAPIVYKNDEQRIVFGPVLIPNEPDTDGDVVSAEHIETVAHKFVEEYGNIDLQHSLNNVGKLVESYILPVDIDTGDGNIVPKGSWMMGVRVTDDDSWEAVKNGKLGGFSIMALQKAAMKSSEKSQESKRVTLADLGEDWIVNAVSLVDEPAVPKAKFLAIKSKATKTEVDVTAVEKAIAGSLEERRELVSQELDKQFSGYDKYPYIYSTLMDSVVFHIFDDLDGTRKVYQVGYELGDDGTVNFTEQPQEVLIQESIVDAKNMFGAKSKPPVQEEAEAEAEAEADETQTAEKSLMRKFIEGLGFKSKPTQTASEKAGMALSNSNYEKLQQAKQVIDDLLAVGEKEREAKSKEGTKSMEKNEVQALIDESLKSMDTKLDEVIKSLGKSSQEEDTEANEPAEKATEAEDTTEATETAEKSKAEEEDGDDKYQDLLKQIEALKSKPFSNRLSGQDGAEKSAEAEEEKPTRNAFGFKSK